MSTEGNVIHYDFIEKFIMDLSENGKLEDGGYAFRY